MSQSVPPVPAFSADPAPLAAWHAGWAVAVALLALAGQAMGQAHGPALFGLIAAALPGLFGLILLRRRDAETRALLLGVWSLSATAAAALSGGLIGPLGALALSPLAAGAVLGGRRMVQAGAAGAAVAVVVSLMSAWIAGPPAPAPALAALSALLLCVAGAGAVALKPGPAPDAAIPARAEIARLEGLLAAQPGLSLTLEPTGRVTAAYGSAPPALDVEALFAQGLIAAVHAPDRPLLTQALETALSGRDAAVRFTPRLALDRRIQLIVRRGPDAADGPRLLAQAFDASAQYAHEVGLEAARAEAEMREAGKTRFLANMSHELRTPLNAVLGFSDIMRQRIFGPLPDRYAEYADSIHQAGGHLLDLINDVLDVSKIEAERYALTTEQFDAREAASAAVALVRVNAEAKRVSLSAVLPPDPVPVAADRRALKQIALNLLSNAVKFTPAGGSVTVSLEAIGPYLELVVADTGVGVAPEDVRRLGRPFEQAGSLEQRRQGTGLGLSLVRAFAELHGGRMNVESTLGEGTAVTVRMPVIQVARPAEPGAETAQIIPLRPEAG